MTASFRVVPADGGETYEVVPTQPLDVRFCSPMSKGRMEDSHVLSFLQAVTIGSGGRQPFGLQEGGDPPDRILTDSTGRAWRTELTTLTASDTREAISRARTLGRLVEKEVRAIGDRYPHLHGRRVVLSVMGDDPLPRDLRDIANTIAASLREDRGYVRETGDIDPEAVHDPAGRYPTHGAIWTSVNELGVTDDLLVVASAQTIVGHDSVWELLRSRVSEKDRPENELLIVTVAGPDEWGFLCRPDDVIFGVLQNLHSQERNLEPPPSFLKGIYLHHWNTTSWLRIYQEDGLEAPW